MARTFEEKQREKQQKERQAQLRSERLEKARAEQQAQERREALDASRREAQRAARQEEEARLRDQEARRAQARLQQAAQLQQQKQSSNAAEEQQRNQREQQHAARLGQQQSIAAKQSAAAAVRQEQQSRATGEQQRKQQEKERLAQLREEQRVLRFSKTAGAQKAAQLRAATGQQRAQRRAEANSTRLRDEQRQKETAELQRKELLSATARAQQDAAQREKTRAAQLRETQRLARQQEATRPAQPDEAARKAREEAARAERLREEQRLAAARQLREAQQREQRQQELTQTRKTAAREAALADATPVKSVATPTARPKLAERRAARRKAIAAASAELPPPEEPIDSLPWLKTRGSFLVDQFVNAVYLRGVTCRGLDGIAPADGQSFPDALSLDEASLSTLIDLWGVNLVRLPFQAQTVLSGNELFSAGDFLSGLDDTVAAVTGFGSRVLLSMEAPAGSGPGTTPDSDTFRAWSLLANHYQDEPGVLYELFSSASPLPENWLDIAGMLVGTIRLQNPASLIFLGNGKGLDVSGLPLRFSTGDPVFNMVYTLEVSDLLLPDPDDAQLRALATSYPVFASPWSDAAADFGRSAEQTSNLFSRYGMGWIAANWNAEPRLVPDAAAHDFAPTRWGLIVQRALTQPVKPLLPALRLEDETASAWRLA